MIKKRKFNSRSKRNSIPSRKLYMAIPPSSQSFYCADPSESGVVMRHMFACSGLITRVCILAEFMSGKKATVTVTAMGKGDGAVKMFEIKPGPNTLNDGIDVMEGDKITVSVSPEKEGEAVKKVWISFLFVPEIEMESASAIRVEVKDVLEGKEELKPTLNDQMFPMPRGRNR